MSTRTRREKRRAKRDEERSGSGGFMEFFARADCGCCDVGPMMFRSEASAVRAFSRVGLRNGGTIVDDANVVHEGVDTFYGFWRSLNISG